MKDCKELLPQLTAAARREPVAIELEQHLETCASCRQVLANQRALTAGLAALAQSDPMPPRRLQAALLAEFRQAAPRRALPLRKPLFALAAIAAALILAFLWFKPSAPVKHTIAKDAPPPPIVEQPKAVQPPVVHARRLRKHPRPVAPAEPAQELATDFYPVPYTEPLRPNQRADIFRVEVPRASMAAFGLPVPGGRLDTQVTADVVVGEDGVTRAVRFIRQ